MWHKRTRVHEFVNQQAAASNEGGAIETLLTQTNKESRSFYKDQVAKLAMTLLQKRPFNANAADEVADAEHLPLYDLFSQVVNSVSEARRRIQEKIIWLLLALITGYWSDKQIIAEAPRFFRHFFAKL